MPRSGGASGAACASMLSRMAWLYRAACVMWLMRTGVRSRAAMPITPWPSRISEPTPDVA